MEREKSKWKIACITIVIALLIFNPFRKSVYKLYKNKERFCPTEKCCAVEVLNNEIN